MYSKIIIKNALAVILMVTAMSGCALSGLLEGNDPSHTSEVDPGVVRSYTGAVRLYNSTVSELLGSVNLLSEYVGAVTDELAWDIDIGGGGFSSYDSRSTSGASGIISEPLYASLQKTRITSMLASEALSLYGNEASNGMLGNAYATEGFVIVALADNFCSGIPLTKVPLSGSMQYTAGFTTQQLYEQAVTILDSAIKYGVDSAPVLAFAKLSKARALLGLGRFNEARDEVADIQNADRYTISYSNATYGISFWRGTQTSGTWKVLDNEGINGIRWTSDSAINQDPRVPLQKVNNFIYTTPMKQEKYLSSSLQFPLVTGIEARMIEAEAALQPASNPSGDWLAILNDARATIGLDPLTDPGTANARVNLLFKERAFWFYLGGTRLSDLRRLVRQYNRLPQQVYPSGAYHSPVRDRVVYGDEYVFDVPLEEARYNSLYKGCFDRRP